MTTTPSPISTYTNDLLAAVIRDLGSRRFLDAWGARRLREARAEEKRRAGKEEA